MRLLSVVRREYLERVRSKGFVIGTLVGPVLLAGMMLVPSLVARRGLGEPLRVAVLDASGRLQADVERALSQAHFGGDKRFTLTPAGPGSLEQQRERLRQEVVAGRLDGFLLLPEDVVQSSRAEYYGKNVSNLGDLRLLDRATEDALIQVRLVAAGVDPAGLDALTRPLDLRTIQVSASGEREDRGTSFLFSVVLLMMMYASVFIWGQAVTSSVIEEKNNRVMEVLVSSLRPFEMLAGKLLGVGAAGLTQIVVWSLGLGAAGVYGTAFAVEEMPQVTPLLLASFVAYFVLGFFLYGALYAAVGAAVNSVQEAQNLQFPVILPIVGAMMVFPVILRSPDSGLAVTLSLIPFFTPLLMFLRISVLAPPAWQVLLSLLLTALAVAAAVWLAARIYRVGILMYGKRPTFPELMRWVRHG